VIKRIARWIDDRLGAAAFAEDALTKVFPDHWSFLLGEIALYCFIVLVLTGTFLSFFFDASVSQTAYSGSYEPLQGVEVSEAYESVVDLSFDVRAGLVMRQIHHWAALVFIAAIVVHLCRIFFTGAFRRPREINWIIGVTLLILAIFNGFTGYSLPDDLLSGTGLRIAYSIALSIPLVGTWIAFLIFGGEFPAEEIMGRLLVVHIFIVPVLIAVLITVHLAIIWRQKHTQFPGPGRLESNVVGPRLWPTYAAKSVGLFFGVFAVLALLGGLVQINPVWLYGPFEPQQVTSPAQPDWYLGWDRGCSSNLSRLGDPRIRLRDPESVLSRGVVARPHVRVAVRVAFSRGARHRRQGTPSPARPSPRSAREDRSGGRHADLLRGHLLRGQ
jgi:ubiquinol-cytochrome c reductase cytochrome b subunit